jgi:hypothetical protein
MVILTNFRIFTGNVVEGTVWLVTSKVSNLAEPQTLKLQVILIMRILGLDQICGVGNYDIRSLVNGSITLYLLI